MHGLVDRVPLRVKLVAAILVLVLSGLMVIGVTSVVALRSYLTDGVDQQLGTAARNANAQVVNENRRPTILAVQFVQTTTTEGVGQPPSYSTGLSPEDLPPLVTGVDRVSAAANRPYTVVSLNHRVRWRMLVSVLSDGAVLHLGVDLSTVENTVGRLIFVELLFGGGALILLATIGVGMVRTSLRPLREIERTAAAIAQGDLTRRVPELEGGDGEPRTEVGRLGRALNTMLGQIETAFTARAESEARSRRSEERMRQFVADASHELRTPLTTIRGFAELYRQVATREPDQADKLVRRIEEEAARMGLLVEDLLLLARLDMERPLEPVELELRVIGNDAVTAARAVAPDREITLDIPPDTGPLTVLADESRLRQVVGNLMTNALTHTPAGTAVWLRLRADGDDAVIEVADAGPGLRPEQAERVFERFYRADAARTRQVGAGSGTGLGLAIVAALVKAHSGSVEVDAGPGVGATFRVRLPIHR
ncbi:MAG: two-component sensor histidine kinase [Actinobacteria bacterium 13_2_20CM_2_72_6]|nr:MAG: two-component sensor histidine kinase [Actinobacteria bacterium 13_2_20CM_2_72_6]